MVCCRPTLHLSPVAFIGNEEEILAAWEDSRTEPTTVVTLQWGAVRVTHRELLAWVWWPCHCSYTSWQAHSGNKQVVCLFIGLSCILCCHTEFKVVYNEWLSMLPESNSQVRNYVERKYTSMRRVLKCQAGHVTRKMPARDKMMCCCTRLEKSTIISTKNPIKGHWHSDCSRPGLVNARNTSTGLIQPYTSDYYVPRLWDNLDGAPAAKATLESRWSHVMSRVKEVHHFLQQAAFSWFQILQSSFLYN